MLKSCDCIILEGQHHNKAISREEMSLWFCDSNSDSEFSLLFVHFIANVHFSSSIPPLCPFPLSYLLTIPYFLPTYILSSSFYHFSDTAPSVHTDSKQAASCLYRLPHSTNHSLDYLSCWILICFSQKYIGVLAWCVQHYKQSGWALNSGAEELEQDIFHF